MTDFEPDQFTLELLGSEHEQFTWIGPKLLTIASRIRSAGGSKHDYQLWVQASYLWRSYQGSTSDSVHEEGRNLERAWQKSADSKPFNLEDELSGLADRVASAYWGGRSGSRNRAVALALIGFCADHNCFTRTISSYELSKYTPGMSQKTVHNALKDLVELRVLTKLDRRDRRQSSRSTSRYQINLYWKPKCVTDLRSTWKDSLSTLRTNRDIWSSKGLGQTAGRLFEVLAEEPATVRELSARAGLSVFQARRAATTLADHCLAGVIPGRPVRYFAVEAPLDAIEEALGCVGYIERVIDRTERRQEANRTGYPSNYNRTGTYG